jgi:cyclopropane fatty-acyl-phospholipid synthase-like methyltransferase
MINLVVATKEFNIIDKLIAYLRSSRIKKYINNGDRVLDFGCGNQGYFLKYVREIINEGIGFDSEVENGNYDNLMFIKFIFKNKLPDNIGKFDKIVMLAVLEHIEVNNVDNLLAEFKKVLKNKGQIILTTPTPISKPLLEILAKLGIINNDEIADHKKYYSKTDITELAHKNKLKLVSYKLFQLGFNSEIIFEKT